MNDFLEELGITIPGKMSKDGSLIVDISDSGEFGKIYSLLDKSDLLEERTDNTLITVDDASIIYVSDDYQLNLIGDFVADQYKLVVNEI